MEEASVAGAAATVLILFVLHSILRLYYMIIESGRVSSLSAQEVSLTAEIKELHRAANALASPETFAKSAKLKRAAASKEKMLLKLRNRIAYRKGKWAAFSAILPHAIKAGVYLSMVWWFWNSPVAIIPATLLAPFEHMVGSVRKDPSGDQVMVSIIPWLALSSRVIDYAAKIYIPPDAISSVSWRNRWKVWWAKISRILEGIQSRSG